ncbi:hypothetical protein [Aurantibacter sp.]|uniref:hypothetical protein n=1 Tax=Aurantibacter sp. TaxID=2807103 RepID=UPI0035C83E89
MNKLYVLLITSMLLACKQQKETNPITEVVSEAKVVIEKVDNHKLFSILGNFSKPLTNNLNANIALSSIEGDKLFMYSKNNSSIPKLIYSTPNIGNNFAWTKDGIHIVFKEKTADYQTKIIKLNTTTLEKKELKNLPKHTALKALKISDTIYYLDQKTLAVKAKFKSKEWTISSEKGNYYNIEVSPNNKYIIAHKGAFIYLFTTSGEFIRKLGKGIATAWHSNSKQIIGFIDSSVDGHQITGSELYLYHITDDPIQITHSVDEIETWPSFKNNSEVMFRDEKRNGVFSTNIKEYIN